MAQATLTIDLSALRSNWRNLNSMTQGETGAVVKADAYGLGAGEVAKALMKEGATTFFVALTEEGVALRKAIGSGPVINVFSGHMPGDAMALRDANLTPMLNSIDQMLNHVETLPGHPFGVQLDTGMNRLGMEPAEWSALRDIALSQRPTLIMSHLACADEPDHPMNAHQLQVFHQMTDGLDVPLSLSATGGILLGPDYHFDLCRPGIGLYGGLPFVEAAPVVSLDVPVIQVRDVTPGESVGYGNSWVARTPARIATIAAGYADGLIRAMGPKAHVWAGETRCKIIGRVSMDMIAVDVTALEDVPETVEMLGMHQFADTLADAAGTIGYEILTSLGQRYRRRYLGA
ncbi:alanine racemase [Pseudoprimorskyibacter insulae]|uniref:Alanine racemase n=1 Tax=Pseudoprimorskyibacter insulae TaxID=1695997 RepID=A0A2R8AWW0_9RHOB|nr:alanine racemase [Pseudoprimorskyibacter insulae]SPF80502.1 Alanine racemase, biosynthetic [Pseudoprimorskyibacter insulae]